ncbi:MAG: hypothetical protein F6K56_37175, partial [Moorea sp. SIO3G5]|nr:hypothetical protein [Moorena sp. SIO3G5]
DIIRIILDIPGIKTVRIITISSDKSSESEEWALALDPNLTPQLKDIDGLTSNITFYKGQIPCNPNLAKAKTNLESLQQKNTQTPSTTQTKDIPIPVGQYRELSDYESIQNDFPATYGIGEIALPASAPPKRKAQAKQLQAYLMFFDQLLANYFAQLDHAKDLFSFQTKNKTTYFYQELYSIPGAPEILNFEQNSPEDQWNDIDKIRKNRFLDHLMAQFCEKFTDYSLLLYESILEEKLINDKITFLQNYPQISAGRGKAFNYTDSSQVWDTENVSGLKQRICSLLGIPYHRKTLALCNESDETEGFHIVEHILLRPRSSNDPDSDENFSEFKSNTDSNTDSNTIDPYSFQISFVFPDWLPRFQEENFKQLIYNIIIAEIPAHITPYCHWLDKPNMIKFENAYQLWLNTKMDKKSTNNLIEFLVNGSISTLPFNVLGYMTIGTDFEVIC